MILISSYILLSVVFLFDGVLSSNLTLSLLYPTTDILSLGFIHYASAFTMAVEFVNNISKHVGLILHLNYTIDNTAVGNQGEETLRIITRKSQQGVNAFIGPGLETCSHQAKLAAAFGKPLIAYVSKLKLGPPKTSVTERRSISPEVLKIVVAKSSKIPTKSHST